MKFILLPTLFSLALCPNIGAQHFKIVDTGQENCYEDIGLFPKTPSGTAHCPKQGNPYYGQDAQYSGAAPSYQWITAEGNKPGSSKRMVFDNNTGLSWMHDLANDPSDLETTQRFTFKEAHDFVAKMNKQQYAGFSDWRMPDIKELYSLILFSGSSCTRPPAPYIDTAFFEYASPQLADDRAGPQPPDGFRPIDGQFWSSTEYAGRILHGFAAAFGVNFADGRIKAYPTVEPGRTGKQAAHFLRCVRGPKYGVNRFTDNGNGTITDEASGLMWTKFDSHSTTMFQSDSPTMDWETALNVAEKLNYAGYQDWRLPNAKELQSIVDYTRAPDARDPGPGILAIDPIFSALDPGAWHWTSTTHLEDRGGKGTFAVTLCFGPATCIGRSGELIDVHGAGAQRSSPKSNRVARPEWLTNGLGPQRDEIRINNYIRCVRRI